MSELKISCEAVRMTEETCDQFRNDPGELISILHAVQNKLGYLPEPVQKIIARKLGIPASKVYGVVTFYSFFSMTPKGKIPISVCLGTACYVKGSQKILDTLSEELKIQPGDTTDDGLFTLNATRCLGACGLAPVMMIGEDVFGRLTPDQVPGILDKFRA